jgi:hypothetical protein
VLKLREKHKGGDADTIDFKDNSSANSGEGGRPKKESTKTSPPKVFFKEQERDLKKKIRDFEFKGNNGEI